MTSCAPADVSALSSATSCRSRRSAFRQPVSYPFKERWWWRIEKGQVLPAGLQLVHDGAPPGHCTLTVERSMTVQAFLALVACAIGAAAVAEGFITRSLHAICSGDQ